MKGGCKDEARLFSAVPCDGARGSEHKLKYRRFPLNTRKHIFTVRVTEHWHRFLRVSVESTPSLEILKDYMDMVLDTRLEQGA